MISSFELRQKYLDFFVTKNHKIIPSASLIPENDPTVLFTTAGMHPLVPYLLGQPHPSGKRLANVQKCVRMQDIDDVGDNRHDTFFEMLGNWSLGEYFKKESIQWSWEFLTSPVWLGLDPKKISVTVFAGDENAPRDEESAEIWKSAGMPEHKIAFLPKADNWWGPAGTTGPCGPDTEIFWWRGETEYPPEGSNCATDPDNWLEIWNNVFMQYEKRQRTILVDGMYTLYDDKFAINQQVLEVLNKFPTCKKIVVVNGYAEKAKEIVQQFGFDVVSYEGEFKKDNSAFFERLFEQYKLTPDQVIYFDHASENIEGAKAAEITNILLFIGDANKLNDFVSQNVYCFIPLKQQNVDTGMGLERTLMTLNGLTDTFQVDTFWPLIQIIQNISGREYIESPEVTKSMRIVADHIRTAVMIMGDDRGIAPSNVDQGYIVRRLIRRAVRHGRVLGLKENFCARVAEEVIRIFKDVYPEVARNREFIMTELAKEESKFRNTIEQGMKEFEKLLSGFQIAFEKMGERITEISGKQAFKLFESYGFPLEMTLELANENGLTVDVEGFEHAFKAHQEMSRAGAEQKFKGGLADQGEMSVKYHTATHLLHAALRAVLGEHVAQRGSNITAERMRFDFSHPDKMTEEQKQRVEDLVNYAIQKDYHVDCAEMTVAEAKDKDAIGLFEDKYGAKVKVYSVGDPNEAPSAHENSLTFSKEICGGPHVTNTGVLGVFKIIKEEAVSAGVRRIKATLS